MISLTWQRIDLTMTRAGFDQAARIAPERRPGCGHVYVHGVDHSDSGVASLRIGISRQGVVTRWFRSASGHRAAFMHHNCGCYNAHRYPHYALFFRLVAQAHRETSLYVADVEVDALRGVERRLITALDPVWERFKKETKGVVREGTDIGVAVADHRYESAAGVALPKLPASAPLPTTLTAEAIR